MKTTRENSGPPCPICTEPRQVTAYATKTGRRSQRVYTATTCGKKKCQLKAAEKKRAQKYLAGSV